MQQSNAVAIQPRPTLLGKMASRFNMDPQVFEQVVRSTVMPEKHNNEQFAALMMVAHEYNLNPVVKEIYAFPAKGGGIVPIVSIDGWLNLINSHPQFDGFDVEFQDADNGDPISCTVRMYRKDRTRPVVVTEYFSECYRNTDPWKMKHRMLRHKAVIQAARYCFGFSGIYEEDEGERMKDITPSVPAPPPPPLHQSPSAREHSPALAAAVPDETEDASPPPAHPSGTAQAQQEGQPSAPPPPAPPSAPPAPPAPKADADEPINPDQFLKELDEEMEMARQTDPDEVDAVWFARSPEDVLEFPPDLEQARAIYDKHRQRLGRPA